MKAAPRNPKNLPKKPAPQLPSRGNKIKSRYIRFHFFETKGGKRGCSQAGRWLGSSAPFRLPTRFPTELGGGLALALGLVANGVWESVPPEAGSRELSPSCAPPGSFAPSLRRLRGAQVGVIFRGTPFASPTFPTEFSFGSSLSGSHLPSAGLGLGLGLVANGVWESVAWRSVACREGRLGGAYLRRSVAWGSVPPEERTSGGAEVGESSLLGEPPSPTRSSLGEGRWEFSFGRLGWELCSHLRSP